MFRSDRARNAKRAEKSLRSRKLSVESLEARQLLSATPYDNDDLLAAAPLEPVVSDCAALVVQEGAVVEQASSLTNTIDRLLSEAGQDPEHISEDFVFNLSSNPSSTYTIYLDFNGNVATGTLWNGGNDVVTPAYDTDGNLNSFSNSELRDIYEVWLRVSEDYMPFNVNVTTKEPTAAQLAKSSAGDTAYGVRAAIGGSCYDWYNSSCGGVAYVGSFDWNSDTPAFIFPKQLYSAKNVAEAASHEVGHTMGLGHDGTSSQGYYGGADGWAPIMGVGYSQTITQWSKGEYNDANNHEDDLEKITSKGFDYRKDDHGDTIAKATPLTFAATGVIGKGIVERNTDVDFFSFELAGQQSVITVGGYAEVTNLDAIVSLYDADKNLIATYDPTNTTYVSIDVSDFPAGKYYMSVAGTGLTVDGAVIYSDYASLGAYTIETALSSDVADPYEPNDTQVGAYRLGVITEPTTINAQIDPRSDNDYFNFSIGAGFSGVKLTLDYDSTSTLSLYFNPDGTWSHATNNGSKSFYALDPSDSLYFRVNASNFKSATSYRVTITPLENPELTSVTLSTTKAKVGYPITAILPYAGLTANYQWYRGTNDGDMVAIPGAIDATYVPTSDDLGYALKVVASGYGNCFGSASATSEKVAAQTVWTVGSLSDAASSSPLTLRQALASAGAGDRIVFDASLDGQTITVNTELVVNKEITIDATALPNGIKLSGNNGSRILNASDSNYLCVKGLTFANAVTLNEGAAIYFNSGILDVQDCLFVDNSAAAGAAIYAYGGKISVANSVFNGNTANGDYAYDGGAIFADYASSLTVSYSQFDGNKASKSGAAIRAFGELFVENSAFTNNVATNVGGAIWTAQPSTFVNCLIADNQAGSYGGGIYAVSGFEAYNCTVVKNSVTYFGGGLYVESGAGYVYNSIVLLNSSQRASGADLEKESGASLYGYNNLTSYTKWTSAEGNKTYSQTKPLFNNADAGDYSLPSNSQAVDVGNNDFVVSTRDITGNTRVYNSKVDLGAYEYMLAPKANLLFQAPLGWDAPVVMNATADAVTNAATFKIGQDYFLRFGLANDSSVAIANSFVIRVFLDGAVVKTYSMTGLAADASANYTLELGQLSAGQHALRVTLDSGNDVDESNENDNVFEATIKVVDDDDYEPNDYLEVATDLGTLLAKTKLDAKAGSEQNEDWFRFTTTTIGTADSFVHLKYEHAAAADLGIAIYNASGVLIVDSLGGQGDEEISLNALEAGTYFVKVVNQIDSTSSIPYELTLQPPAPPKADLTQATPNGWSAPIVVNTTPDATTSAEAFYENQAYYANFCIGNISPTPVAGVFYVDAYVDDVLVQTFTVNKLGAYGTKQYSVELGNLTVGTHMVKIVVDAADDVEEESETNNTFTQTFNVAGVDDEYESNDTIVAAYNLGSLIEMQTLTLWAGSGQNEDWFRFSMPEPGTSAGRVVLSYDHVSELSDVDLYLYDAEGELIAYSNRATGTEMLSLNNLPAGVYYIRAFNCCDVQQSVPYEITLFPSTVAKPNLKPTVLSTWSDSILVASSSSSSSDAETYFDGTNYYVRFAFTNDSSVAIEESFTVKCYLDDVNVKTYVVEPMAIGANRSFSFSTGALALGAHTIRVELDTDNVVDESNKFDNVYAKTIVVESGEDEYEPNDSFEDAYDLGDIAGSKTFSLNAQGGQNEDWFKFSTVSEGFPGDTITLTYEHVPSVADVDLYLYDSEGELIASSKLVTGTETISLEGLPVGEYYVRAYNYFDKTLTVPYDLTFYAPVYRTPAPKISAEAVSPIEIVATVEPVDDATLYTLQYSANADFSDTVTVTSAHAGTIVVDGLEEQTEYFFRAKADSNELPESSWSAVVSVVTPEKQQLAAPAISVVAVDQVTIDVLVSPNEAADAYVLEYANNAEFVDAITLDAVADVNTIDGLKNSTTYYVRVKATAADALDSDWTVAEVTTPALKKLAIPNVKVATTPSEIALTWKPIANAVAYQVEYKTDAEKNYVVVRTTDTNFTLDGVASGVGYTLRVRAMGDQVYNANSDRRVVEVATDVARKLNIPNVKASADLDSIALTWKAIDNAEGYQVEYKLASASINSYKVVKTTDTNYTIEGLKANEEYTVRVRALGNGVNYYNSDRRILDVVTLAAPEVKIDATTNELPYYVGSAVEFATFQVKGMDEYSVSVTVDGVVSDAIAIDGDKLVFNGGLAAGDHEVVLTAQSGDTAVADSMTVVVGMPVLPAPTGLQASADPISITGTWDAVAGAEGYCVRVYSKAGIQLVDVDTVETSVTISGLEEKTTYTIVVEPYASDAVAAENAAIAVTTPAKRKLQIPVVDVKVESTAINVSWKPVENAAGYSVCIKLANSKTYKYYNVNEGTEFRIEGLKPGTDYVVGVRAKTGVEVSLNSDHRFVDVTTDAAIDDDEMFELLAASLLD